MTNGIFGYHRGLAAGSTAVGAGTLLAAVEGVKYNGPWDVPDNVRKINGVMRYSQGTATDGLTLYGDGLFQRLEFDRSGGAARHRPGHHRPVRLARSDRWRRLQPLQRCRAIGRIRANTGRARSTPMSMRSDAAALQQFHLFSRQSRQWRPVQPDRPPHPRWPRREPCLRLRVRRLRDANPRRHADAATTISMSACSRPSSATTLSTVREDRVQEGNVGMWTDTTARWTDWLRTTVGIREDILRDAC